MHSFLISITHDSAEVLLNRAKEKVFKLLNAHCDIQLESTQTGLKNLKGWFVQPTNEKFKLLHSYQNEQLEVIFFGYLVNDLAETDLETVVNIYYSEGIEGVCKCDGIFSCVIYDKLKKQAFIANDLIGHRKLRTYHADNGILISSHDGSLLATGLVPNDISTSRQCYSASIGWSLGGESFVEAINTIPPLHYGAYIEGKLKYHSIGLQIDKQPKTDNIHEIVQELQGYTRNFSGKQRQLSSDLTCGFDSRAVLGLILSSGIDQEKLTVSTVGQNDSTDIIVATKIAKTYSLKHNIIPTPFDVESIQKVWVRAQYKAFLSNGDTHFKRTITSIPSALATHWHTGEGGGIYKGFYFPNDGTLIKNSQGAEQLMKKLGRGFKSESHKEQFKMMLHEHLAHFKSTCPNPYAMMTSFFATEYIGVMGGIVSKFSWFPYKSSPFLSTRALMLSLNTSPKLLKKKTVHKHILDHFLTEIKKERINGQPYFISFNPKLKSHFGKYFTQQIVNHEKQKSQLLAQLFHNGLNELVSKHINKDLIDPDSIPIDSISRSEDKLMMTAAFNSLANWLCD